MKYKEDGFWRGKGDTDWRSKTAFGGDANTGYFHSIANGRRKCRIKFLETGYGRIS
jgi:hypothetical protein